MSVLFETTAAPVVADARAPSPSEDAHRRRGLGACVQIGGLSAATNRGQNTATITRLAVSAQEPTAAVETPVDKVEAHCLWRLRN